METKIKVNLNYRTYHVLYNDMDTFSFLKKDGEVNQNEFLNLLVSNYYLHDKERIERISSLLEEKMKKVHIEKNKMNLLKDEILSVLSSEKKEGITSSKLDYSFSFRPSHRYDDVYSYIENNLLKGISASAYFRSLFESYCMLSQAERECILFKKEYELIEVAINKKRNLIVFLDRNREEFSPYRMDTTKEQNYVYVTGMKNGIACSIHLYKMKNVCMSTHCFGFDKETIRLLEKRTSSAMEFAGSEIVRAEVRLTEKGKKQYRKIWHNRPDYVSVKEDVYSFESPYFQLFNYFLRFSKEAEILSPESLRNDLERFYLEGYEVYHQA